MEGPKDGGETSDCVEEDEDDVPGLEPSWNSRNAGDVGGKKGPGSRTVSASASAFLVDLRVVVFFVVGFASACGGVDCAGAALANVVLYDTTDS